MEEKRRGMFLELDYGKDVKLDAQDKKILAVLSENCRTKLTHIAKIVNLSKDAVRYRISNLIKKDLYRRNVTIINPFAVGLLVYTFLIKMEKVTPQKEEDTITFFTNHPFVLWFGQTQGVFDYNVVMLAAHVQHYDTLLNQVRAQLSGNIKEIKVLHITHIFSCNTLPHSMYEGLKLNITNKKLNSSFGALLNGVPDSSIDAQVIITKSDAMILAALANRSNLTLQEISKETGINADTVKNRIISLIKQNVILAFRALINVSFLHFHGHVAYFRLRPSTSELERKSFETYFKFQNFTAFGSRASGSPYDFQIYMFAKDPIDLHNIISEVRHKYSEIIEEYETILVLKDYKFTFLPDGVKSLLGKRFG